MNDETKNYLDKKLNLLSEMFNSNDLNTQGVKGVSVMNGELNRTYLKKYRFCVDYRGFTWLEFLKTNCKDLGYSLYKKRSNSRNIFIVKNSKERVFTQMNKESYKLNCK